MRSDSSMSLVQKVAQLFIIRSSGHLFDSQREYPSWELPNEEIKYLLNIGVGGVILYGGSTCELHYRCRTFREWASNKLLLCADAEEGIGQRFSGGSYFAPPMAIGQIYEKDPEKAIKYAELYGKSIGEEAIKCGLNWILSPVCDVNTNSTNPVINMRAWGDCPNMVLDLSRALHHGLDSMNILSCAKHFPGHGDTGVDSHLELPVIKHNLNRLEEIELIPFRGMIDEDVSSIMIGHLLLQSIDNNLPATFSSNVIKGLLRDKLGFKGLVVTDALVMNSINNRYGNIDPALMAFEAGADLILMPKKPRESIDAICQAINSGRISMERLDESLQRREKMVNRLDSPKNHNLKDKEFLLGNDFISKDHHILSRELIEETIVIKKKMTLLGNKKGVNLIIVDDRCYLNEFANPKNSPSIRFPSLAGYKPFVIDHLSINPFKDNLSLLNVISEGPILLQIFSRGRPFLGSSFNEESLLLLVHQLIASNRITGLIVYGSPYLWNNVTNHFEDDFPVAYSPSQMNLAQSIILSSFLPKASFKINNNDQFTD